ncbi:gp178 [uncultured Mediterranean phage uvMED]|nr:gp178 [uncultured Mediterranean phage uvMED]
MLYEVKKINYNDTKPFILNIHYAKRMPSISFAYGLFLNNELIGIVSYGSPASPSLCKGIAGFENKSFVIELNRLVLKYNRKNEASMLVGKSLQLLPKPKIIVSYADTNQNHIGFIYQATNFYFTGTSKPRTDMAGKNGKHPRHHLGDKNKRIFRSAKHRYVYIVGNKKDKKYLLNNLKYPLLDYPKKNEVVNG